jgi:hypothetical protein
VSVKLVVSGSSKQSRIALVGKTGKELLTSPTFTEPRAKGATLRALKGLLGADVIVEDTTLTTKRPVKAAVTARAAKASATTEVAEKPAERTAAAAGRRRRQTTAPTAKVPAARKSTRRTAKSVESA